MKKGVDRVGVHDRDRDRSEVRDRERDRDRERERRDSGGMRGGPLNRYSEGGPPHHGGSWNPRFDKRPASDPRSYESGAQTHRPYRGPRIHDKRRYVYIHLCQYNN